jgi:hypothetical protein
MAARLDEEPARHGRRRRVAALVVSPKGGAVFLQLDGEQKIRDLPRAGVADRRPATSGATATPRQYNQAWMVGRR